eukprot:4861175-Amphidinium_carterae.1
MQGHVVERVAAVARGLRDVWFCSCKFLQSQLAGMGTKLQSEKLRQEAHQRLRSVEEVLL